jgi:hypothetical protein
MGKCSYFINLYKYENETWGSLDNSHEY